MGVASGGVSARGSRRDPFSDFRVPKKQGSKAQSPRGEETSKLASINSFQSTMSTTSSPLDDIAQAVPNLDLWQPRDWPHRRGDALRLDLHSFPLTAESPGRRPVDCEHCGHQCLCIHDNVLCWKCKGAFCFHCTGKDHEEVCMTPERDLLDHGFGACHNCREPLRSIALIDVFRGVIEAGGMFIEHNNPSRPMENTGHSLVQEAEDALVRGRDARMNGAPEKAIEEFTHAINAINYLTSSSLGVRLVLRAKDILLASHCERALLEENQGLSDAILAAFPKASVRSVSEEDTNWYLSRSAYRSLYYPFPANAMAGASGSVGGMIGVCMRNQTREEAFASNAVTVQCQLGQVDPTMLSILKQTCPHCDGTDPLFVGLQGTWQGVFVHQSYPPSVIKLGDHSLRSGFVVQFVRVLPTDLAAKEYTRLTIENKKIGEEKPPLSAKDDPELASSLRKMMKDMGVEDVHKVHVLRGQAGPGISISAVLAVGNVSMKMFVQKLGTETQSLCHIVAKAASYLDRQLRELRTTSQSRMPEAPHHHPDLTLCAYCGKEDSPLKACSRCKLARYCSVDCQKQHWDMRGPWAHRPFCKRVVRHTNQR